MKANDKMMIVNSVLWATAILASALVLRGSGLLEQLYLILIGLWFVSFLMLENGGQEVRAKGECVRRFLGAGRKR